MHSKIAGEIIKSLHAKYPTAAVALCGSVAEGTYREDSDIDILFLNKNIDKSYNISFSYKGIRISIFIIQKDLIKRNESKYLFNKSMLPSIIYRSKILYDYDNQISDLKEYISNLLTKEIILKKETLLYLKRIIRQLLEINTTNLTEKKIIFYRIINLIIKLFFVREFAGEINTKDTDKAPFSYIRNRDITLFRALERCIPFHYESEKIITETYTNYIELNY
jgi:predicted nucleotidyltransferase